MKVFVTNKSELRNLSEVNENVSDQKPCSVVLKGLPQKFMNFVTVFKFSHELKSFLDLKRDFFNFDFLKGADQGSSSHFSKDVKCSNAARSVISKRNVGRKLLRSFVTDVVRKVTRLIRVPKVKKSHLISVIRKHKKGFLRNGTNAT